MGDQTCGNPNWLECKQILELGWFEVKTKLRRRFEISLWRELILTVSLSNMNVVWLIKKMRNSLGLLIFCCECADLIPFSTNLCKKAFSSTTERFGTSLFCCFYRLLIACKMEVLVFLSSVRKIEPVTTCKMASHPMDMNIIFQENMCLTDPNHY